MILWNTPNITYFLEAINKIIKFIITLFEYEISD